ncbi:MULTISPECIES: 4-oxalocrotonate tautomerase [unclassified Pseudomonas]|uniref:4-oxalocrotonate tautomerase n=1 Tax=unclassified Pseudomonas TaxID=196821 RepID=UPI000B8913AC|nr:MULTISPECIES: 4-oxalocrotonate tautomerase [unclassified Pseudomonas]
MPIVRVEMLPGRTQAQKAEYAREVTRLTVEILGCTAEAVDVIFSEIDRQDWARAGELYSAPAELSHSD